MLTVTAPIDAYRADLAADPTRTQFTFADADLLRLGTLLLRLTHFSRSERAQQSRLAEEIYSLSVRIVTDPRSDETVSQMAVLPIDRMRALRGSALLAEESGALNLAFTMLHLGYLAFQHEVTKLEEGQILVQRARVARKAGADAQAASLYAEALELGTEHVLPELIARARLGFSLLAVTRGNLPEAHEQVTLARSAADSSGVREVTASIQHQQLLIAARRGDFGEALVHAWNAFRDVEGDVVREAEALTNVGQVLLDAGRTQVSLRAFLAALSRKPPKRLALPALSGAAHAASLTSKPLLVRQLVGEIDALATGADLRHEVIYALGEAAFALAPFAREEAEARRSAAHADAERLGFHALAYRFAELPSAPTGTEMPIVTWSPAAAYVVEQATALEVSAEYASV